MEDRLSSNETGFDSFRAWSSLVVVIVGTFLSAISTTTINVALPTIMNVFSADLSNVQWLSTAYAMAMAITVPLAPYLSKVFSGERVYMVALVVFTTFSFLCGFSGSLNTMMLFRIMQGIGGGLMQPIGMGMVLSLFPPEKRGVAFGVFGIAAISAPAFGPTLGGLIVESLGWQYVFFINLPFGIVAVFLAMKFFTFSKRIPFPKFDFTGFISATIGSSFLLYLLGKNQQLDWNNPFYTYMLIIGVGSIIFFIFNEICSPNPLLALRLLKDRNFSISLALTAITMLLMMSVTFVTPIFIQNFKGMTALQSGQILMPSTIVMALLMPIAGRLTDMLGDRGTKWIIAIGLAICGISTISISSLMNINSSIIMLVIVMSVRNVGMGLSMMPSRTMGLIKISPEDSQYATALTSFISQFSASMSVAFVTSMIMTRFNSNYSYAVSQLSSYNAPFTEAISKLTGFFVGEGLPVSDATTQALQTILTSVYVDNYLLAIQHTVLVTAVIGMTAILVVPFFKARTR